MTWEPTHQTLANDVRKITKDSHFTLKHCIKHRISSYSLSHPRPHTVSLAFFTHETAARAHTTRPTHVATAPRPHQPLDNAANEEAALLAGGRLDDHVVASPVSHSGSSRRYERRTREHGGVARAARGGASRGRESAPGVVTRSKPREACSRQVDGMFTVGLSMMAIETPRRLTTALKPLKTHLSSAHIAGT